MYCPCGSARRAWPGRGGEPCWSPSRSCRGGRSVGDRCQVAPRTSPSAFITSGRLRSAACSSFLRLVSWRAKKLTPASTNDGALFAQAVARLAPAKPTAVPRTPARSPLFGPRICATFDPTPPAWPRPRPRPANKPARESRSLQRPRTVPPPVLMRLSPLWRRPPASAGPAIMLMPSCPPWSGQFGNTAAAV